MWAAIRWLVLRLAAIRWFFKLGWLGMLIPLALLLKGIGLPLLGILSIVALPVLLLLLLFGLPIILVMVFGSLFMGVLGVVLTIGLAAVKFGLFVVLPLWLMIVVGKKLFRWIFRRGPGEGDCGGNTSPPASPTTPQSPPPAGSTAGFDEA